MSLTVDTVLTFLWVAPLTVVVGVVILAFVVTTTKVLVRLAYLLAMKLIVKASLRRVRKRNKETGGK